MRRPSVPRGGGPHAREDLRVDSSTERSAALASEQSPPSALQFVCLTRDANLPDRKLFVHQDELAGWLSGVLSAAEPARLKTFLAEGAGP